MISSILQPVNPLQAFLLSVTASIVRDTRQLDTDAAMLRKGGSPSGCLLPLLSDVMLADPWQVPHPAAAAGVPVAAAEPPGSAGALRAALPAHHLRQGEGRHVAAAHEGDRHVSHDSCGLQNRRPTVGLSLSWRDTVLPAGIDSWR